MCRCLQDQDTERNETQYRSVRLGVRDHILGIGVRTSDVERSLAERCRYGMLRNRHLGSGCRLFVQYTGQERILELWYRTLEHVQYGLRIAGDTLSYIRLFAIGLTGSILGGVFNTLAVTMTDGMNIVARAICMLLILLVGHSINIALCTISSLVHPLRLIFVEYYKNAEFEGGGKAYEPFRKA